MAIPFTNKKGPVLPIPAREERGSDWVDPDPFASQKDLAEFDEMVKRERSQSDSRSQ